MRYLFTVSLCLLFLHYAPAQIIKKKQQQPSGFLEKIKINDLFTSVPLDSVYNTFSRRYGMQVNYDTDYCRTILFSYWYSGTVATRALEITTRGNDLYYRVDSATQNIYVKTRHYHHLKHKVLPIHSTGPVPAALKTVNKDYSIRGHIVDDSTGEMLAGALISVKNSTAGTTSRDDGSYVLEHVQSDTAKISVTYLGYNSVDVVVTPETDKTDFPIGLTHVEHELSEFQVTANRADIMNLEASSVSAIKLTPAKLAEIPNVGEKDLMRTFQLMPGISAANESSSGLYVRGGTPDQNLVIFDGFTVYQVDHLYGFFSAFNANTVKDVVLYKGGFSAKYGGRLSSVTDITGKEGSTTKFNIGGDLSLLSVNLFTEIPVTEDLSVVAAFRRSWNGPIYNWIFNSFNRSSQSRPSGGGPGGAADNVTKAKSYFYDINTRVTYKPTKKDVLIYSFFNGKDDLNNSFTINTPAFLASLGISLNFGTTDVTTYGNSCMSAIWQREWHPKLHSTTTLSFSDFSSNRNRVTSGAFGRGGSEDSSKTGVFENNNLKDLSLKSEFDWEINRWNHLGFGVFATDYDISYTYSHSDTDLLVNNHNSSVLAGGYVQDQFLLFDKRLTFTPGIRYSYFDKTGKTYWEPRSEAIYRVNSRLSLKAAYGQFYQFANRITRDDISAGSSTFWVLSDGKTVPVSQSVHYISGISYELPTYLFSIEAYRKNLSNISLYTETTTATTSTINYNQNFYSGKGISKGIEFTAQKKLGRFTGWVSYTLSQTNYLFQAYSNSYFPADQDVRNEFKIVSMYKYKHWDFAATWIYASGKPYTAPGGSYSITLLDGTSQNYVSATSKNSLRLPDYHRLDVAVNYHFYNQAKKDVGYIGLSLFNVYARENVWYKEFTVVDKYVVETNVDYLGFTPNLTLSLKLR